MRGTLLLAMTLVVVAGCYKQEAEELARENAELRGRIAELEKRAKTAESELEALKASADEPAPPTVLPLDQILGEKLRAAGVDLVEKEGVLRWSANGKGGPIKGDLTLTEADTRGTLLGRTTMKSYSIALHVRLVGDDGVILKNIDERTQTLGISPEHALKSSQRNKVGMVDQAVAAIVEAVK